MAGLLDELIATLEEELQIYNELIPIAEAKTAIIIKNDVVELERITVKEELAVEKTSALEKKRGDIMQNMRIVLNREKSDLKIPELIELLSGQPESQKELSRLYKELKATIDRLVTVNGHNSKLIQESLEINEYRLNIFRSTKSYYGNNYTSSAGESSGSMLSSGSFDTKR